MDPVRAVWSDMAVVERRLLRARVRREIMRVRLTWNLVVLAVVCGPLQVDVICGVCVDWWGGDGGRSVHGHVCQCAH